MYAMEYTKQERTAPAVITIVAHLVLVYAFAASMGVVPSPLERKPFVYVPLPEEPLKPMPKDNIPVDSPTGTPNTLHLHDPTPPTIVLADETPPFKPDEPNIVGGDPPIIDEAITSVRVLSSPEPMYPLVSRARDEAGTVFVKVMISPYGIASDAQVAKSSGYPRLDEAAIKAVKGWRFAPAKRGSQAIATWVTVPVKFVLNARG